MYHLKWMLWNNPKNVSLRFSHGAMTQTLVPNKLKKHQVGSRKTRNLTAARELLKNPRNKYRLKEKIEVVKPRHQPLELNCLKKEISHQEMRVSVVNLRQKPRTNWMNKLPLAFRTGTQTPANWVARPMARGLPIRMIILHPHEIQSTDA
jgi:hypothetical protein